MSFVRLMAAQVLSIVPLRQPLGTRLFNVISKYSVNVAFEAVLLRRGTDGEMEVFLSQRLPTETFANLWHVPGSIFRPGEVESGVAERLAINEFGVERMDYQFCGDVFSEYEGRTYLHRVYKVVTSEEVSNAFGKWYEIDSLPLGMVQIHKDFVIPLALKNYEGH